jgi:hypothetical protein
MFPKQPRKLPEAQHPDRKDEPKPPDAEDRDLSGAERGDLRAQATFHRMIKLETCVHDQMIQPWA